MIFDYYFTEDIIHNSKAIVWKETNYAGEEFEGWHYERQIINIICVLACCCTTGILYGACRCGDWLAAI